MWANLGKFILPTTIENLELWVKVEQWSANCTHDEVVRLLEQM